VSEEGSEYMGALVIQPTMVERIKENENELFDNEMWIK
jgi:hypothetical protein